MAVGRKTGGRRKGALNKATADVRAAASKHGPAALETLARLMREADTDAAKIAAAREILDRAYGRPTQPIAGDDKADPLRVGLKVSFVGGAAG